MVPDVQTRLRRGRRRGEASAPTISRTRTTGEGMSDAERQSDSKPTSVLEALCEIHAAILSLKDAIDSVGDEIYELSQTLERVDEQT
jgi:hypothetical protein